MSDKADNTSIKRMQAGKAEIAPGIRLKEALGHRDMAWLSRETGISTSTLSDYGRGKLPRADKALQIAKALGVSFEFLMGDEEAQPAHLGDRRAGFRGAEPERDPDLVEITEIDLRYGLGGTFLDTEVATEKRMFSREWLRNFTHTSPELLFWTIGDGDSMEPTIRSGEVVLIDVSEKTPRMAEGIWAIAMGEIGMIKRLHFPSRDRIELLSDNKLIPPIVVAQDELHVVGRVVAVVRRL